MSRKTRILNAISAFFCIPVIGSRALFPYFYRDDCRQGITIIPSPPNQWPSIVNPIPQYLRKS